MSNYPKGERRRAEIVAAALTAFGTVGYRSASMVQIAADCGVSRAGLLHHFPTKESLLEAVLKQRDRQDYEQFFRGGTSDDGLDYFSRYLRLVEHNAANPGIVSLYAMLSTEASDPDHPAHAYFVERYERTRGWLRRALADLDARGLLRVDADGIDVEILSVIDGLQIQWLLAPSSVDMPRVLRSALSRIVTIPLP
ncbi:MAG: TetR/AcrR family transcriptional regulator [Microbacterium sp.]